MMQSIQNLGLFLVPMLSGTIVDKRGYLWLEMQFSGWVVITLIVCVWIWLLDLVGRKRHTYLYP